MTSKTDEFSVAGGMWTTSSLYHTKFHTSRVRQSTADLLVLKTLNSGQRKLS